MTDILTIELVDEDVFGIDISSEDDFSIDLINDYSGTSNYNDLINKPSINGVELRGNKTSEDLGIPIIFVNTTEYWNSQPSLITVRNAVYIYTDYEKDGDGDDVPGIKVGDGLGYLIDAPFTSDPYYDHIRNHFIHITPEEREFWNNKVRCYVDDFTDSEKLIFTTN